MWSKSSFKVFFLYSKLRAKLSTLHEEYKLSTLYLFFSLGYYRIHTTNWVGQVQKLNYLISSFIIFCLFYNILIITQVSPEIIVVLQCLFPWIRGKSVLAKNHKQVPFSIRVCVFRSYFRSWFAQSKKQKFGRAVMFFIWSVHARDMLQRPLSSCDTLFFV